MELIQMMELLHALIVILEPIQMAELLHVLIVLPEHSIQIVVHLLV
jgi:hypothetical protein